MNFTTDKAAMKVSDEPRYYVLGRSDAHCDWLTQKFLKWAKTFEAPVHQKPTALSLADKKSIGRILLGVRNFVVVRDNHENSHLPEAVAARYRGRINYLTLHMEDIEEFGAEQTQPTPSTPSIKGIKIMTKETNSMKAAKNSAGLPVIAAEHLATFNSVTNYIQLISTEMGRIEAKQAETLREITSLQENPTPGFQGDIQELRDLHSFLEIKYYATMAKLHFLCDKLEQIYELAGMSGILKQREEGLISTQECVNAITQMNKELADGVRKPWSAK